MNKSPIKKIPKEIDCSNCKNQCTIKINEDLRAKICDSFWKLNYTR